MISINKHEDVRPLTLFGYRDFTLGLWEIGVDAESLPLLHLENREQVRPHFVIKREGVKETAFIDLFQVERQKQLIFEQLKKDPLYVQNLLKKTEEVCGSVNDLFNNPHALERGEIGGFVNDLKLAWRWYAGLWWAIERIEDEEGYEKDVEETMSFREKTDKFVPGADDVVRKTILSLYPHLKKYKEVILLSEVLEDKIPIIDELEKRLERCYLIDGKIYIEEPEKSILSKYRISLCYPEAQVGIKEFHGRVAYKGKYQGVVKKIFTKEDAYLFKDGHVLVASSSTPDFLPAIQKAGAIVADEGGVMSHAAICSRELKKPCIIGTKIATQVLNDGDLVEVDADNGVVRVISSGV